MSVVVYENALCSPEDIRDFYIEGEADISFESGFMRLATSSEAALWFPKVLPADIRIDWDYRPVKEPGASELIFAAKPSPEGDRANAYLLTYFKRRNEKERLFHTSCLYKDSEKDLLYRGGDPLPDAREGLMWYHLSIVKRVGDVFYGINNLEVLHYSHEGMTHGDMLTGGNMAFRQSGNMIAEYRNLKVTWI